MATKKVNTNCSTRRDFNMLKGKDHYWSYPGGIFCKTLVSMQVKWRCQTIGMIIYGVPYLYQKEKGHVSHMTKDRVPYTHTRTHARTMMSVCELPHIYFNLYEQAPYCMKISRIPTQYNTYSHLRKDIGKNGMFNVHCNFLMQRFTWICGEIWHNEVHSDRGIHILECGCNLRGPMSELGPWNRPYPTQPPNGTPDTMAPIILHHPERTGNSLKET